MSQLEQIFNRVKTHLLNQEQKAVLSPGLPGEACAYRGVRNRSCAVGCLITDEAYDSRIESQGVMDKSVRTALDESGIPTDDETLDLLNALQFVHDNYEPSEWPHQLGRVREEYIN